MLRKL
ncbi:hypothetical protein ASZ78_015108 [Callipepla squamata]